MRVFVPATMADLAVLHRDGALPVASGYALTDRYRAAVGAEIADDDEVLDYDLLMAAAAGAGKRPRADHDHRRVVLAVDLPAQPDAVEPASGRVVVDGPLTLPDVVAVHVDDVSDGRLAPNPATDLLWYAPQEIVDLL